MTIQIVPFHSTRSLGISCPLSTRSYGFGGTISSPLPSEEELGVEDSWECWFIPSPIIPPSESSFVQVVQLVQALEKSCTEP